MEQRVKVGIGGFVGVIIMAFAILLFLPRNFLVERSIVIDAAPVDIYEQVVDLKKNEAWSPWLAADPDMKIAYGENTRGKGASSSWTSSNNGNGSLVVEVAQGPVRIENALDFGPNGNGRGTWTFEAQGQETHVTWSMTAHAPGLMGGVFAAMADGMVGPSFEDGLARLKTVAESLPPPPPPERAGVGASAEGE